MVWNKQKIREPIIRVFLGLIIILSAYSCVESTSEKIEDYLEYCYQNCQFNGSVLVSKNGEVIYQEALGIANIDPLEPLQINSQFRLASLSKPFTAMAILILKEQGKLDYEDDITKYLPELPYPGITIRNLLTHTGGILEYEDLFEKYWDPEHKIFLDKKYANNEDVIDMFVKYHTKPLFKPGDKYAYSNTGYVFLASIVSRASGEPFEVFLKKNVFDPLDMSNTLVYSAIRNETMENRVYGFRLALNGSDYISHDFHYMSGIAGDGAIYSTTGDLYQWDRALYSESLVSRETLEKAFTPVILNNSSTSTYGFGWGIDTSLTGKKVVNHGGGWIASKTWLWREIEDNNTIIILTNNSYRYIYDIRKALKQILHNKPYSVPKISIADIIGKICVNNGIESAIAEYHHLKKSNPEMYNFTKWELNNLGYQLTQQEKYAAAIEIYKLNSESYPKYSNAYSGLGEAYRLNGDVDLAIKNFEKALEIYPNNRWAKQKLNLLTGKNN